MVSLLNNELDKLFEFNNSILVSVKPLDESLEIFLINAQIYLVKHTCKLNLREDSIVVPVELSEYLSEDKLFGMSLSSCFQESLSDLSHQGLKVSLRHLLESLLCNFPGILY